jgi:hypothetical protein
MCAAYVWRLAEWDENDGKHRILYNIYAVCGIVGAGGILQI